MNALLETKSLIDRSQRILILLPENYCQPSPKSGMALDIFCSAKSLAYLLDKAGKDIDIFAKEVPQKFQSLGLAENQDPKSTVITINTEDKEIAGMKYEKDEKSLKIFLALSQGVINKDDLFLSEEQSSALPEKKPDLIITLGAESLEELPQDNLEGILMATPMVNIDNQTGNQGFGQINLVADNAAAISEIVVKIAKDLYQESVDGTLANYLLTGIVSATSNFRNLNMRSKTFENISWLIEKGADYQKILKGLGAAKNQNQIRLLGRILEKISLEKEKGIYLAQVTRKDFFETESQPKDLAEIVQELRLGLGHTPLLLLWESHASPPAVRGIFYSQDKEAVSKIMENFGMAQKGEGVLFLIKERDINIAKEKALSFL